VQPSTNKTTWETAGTILVVLAAGYAVIRWPLWWTFERLVMAAISGRRKDLRATIESEFSPEFAARAETAATATANEDRLSSAQAAIEAQGLVLRDIPRMSGMMGEMTRTLLGLNKAVDQLNQNMLEHGSEIGRVTGFIESGAWQGPERRKKGRRGEDPAIDDGS
jgi:hypothetical protein